MRVLVCGDRNWTDEAFIAKRLLDLWLEREYTDTLTIIEGCAKGVDSIAGAIGRRNRLEVIEFPANWSKFGRAAGPIRNQQMLDEGKPDLVIAFHDTIETSKGTKDMVERAKKAGIKTIVYRHGVVSTVYPGKEYHESKSI